jgi:type II secretory pathway component PulK
MLIYFSSKASVYTQNAEKSIARTEALLSTETALADIQFHLLTGSELKPNSGFVNYFGRHFRLENVEVEIQDLHSLIALTPFGVYKLREYLESQNVAPDTVNSIVDSVDDWQDADDLKRIHGAEQGDYTDIDVRNGTMSDVTELAFIFRKYGVDFDKFQRDFTIYPVHHFNPLNVPDNMLRLISSDEQRVSILSKLRETQSLTEADLVRIVGYQFNERDVSSHGNAFRITLRSRSDGLGISQTYEFKFSPYGREPVVLWNYNRGY